MIFPSLNVRCEEERLVLPGYSFPSRGTRVLAPGDIVEMIAWFPFALRTVEGEFLMAGRHEEGALRAWCARCGVPVVKRYDAWADLLDPFLDTEHSLAFRAGGLRSLAGMGLDADAVRRLRVRVEGPMLHLTMMSWEWEHYGLNDVLCAMRPLLLTRRKSWRMFYAEAMAIAAQGCERGPTLPAPDAPEPPSSR